MKNKFKIKGNDADFSWLDVRNEHVMVWFQMESIPSFTKLWGHMNETLYPGINYTLVVQNNWLNVTKFKGMKSVYLSEVNSFGGKNAYLGIGFLALTAVVGAIMVLFVFLYFRRIRGYDLYSTSNLSWD